MSLPKRNTRRIVVNDRTYHWYLRDNDIWDDGKHVAIQHADGTGQLVLLDPYPYYVEIRPGFVRDVILFALAQRWQPGHPGKPIYVTYDGQTMMLLPEGQHYRHKPVS